MRALVPVLNRIETGYVIDLAETTEVPNIRRVIDLPDATPVFAPEMIALCRWVADYYCCSLGEALHCAVPSGLKIRTTLRYTLVPEQISSGRYSERQRKIIAELYRRGPLTEGQVATVVGRGALSNSLQSLAGRGVLQAEPVVSGAGVSMRTETYVRLNEARILPTDALAALQRTAPKQAAVYLDLLHGESERPVTELYNKHKVTAAVITALEKKGLVSRIERDFLRTPAFEPDDRSRVKFSLNADQQAAYEAIIGAVGQGEFRTFLLHGVTGSGKTEVYLQAIEYALSLRRNAILLVPEISLTPQTVGRLIARFQEQIAVLHSALGKGERYDEWRRAQRGEVRIVVGARSAIFAPLPNVGLIVVDEEHDTSYKQTDAPRYHARDAAIMRANMAGAVCVLGSATPSVESYYKSETGRFTRLALLHRAATAALPEVRLVDMREETRETGGQVILSRILEEEVQARLRAGEQVILLLNRRGYAPFVLCPKCGWVAECRNCNVSLTYHASGACLICHYCNARSQVPAVCGACQFNPLLFLGTGTQKAEDSLMRMFRGARVARMDADTTSGKGGHAKILGRFAAGQIDILLGTQMIAKGHDYPGVTLVGVLSADTSLSLPDFRAAENTFQLLTQVAGRAGRGNRPGKVILQTYRPNHYAILAATRHDYTAFYRREITERQTAGYPPLRRMANLAIECEDPLLAERCMALLERIVREQVAAHGFKGVEILGPSPAVVHRVKKKYRWNLGLLSKSAQRLNVLARAAHAGFTERSPTVKALLKIDLDPYGVF
jgi:primosomal protein N' (replication factor Y)